MKYWRPDLNTFKYFALEIAFVLDQNIIVDFQSYSLFYTVSQLL